MLPTPDHAPLDLSAEFLPLLKALADETRLRIVGLLATKAYTVEELAAALSLRPSTVSHHLARLTEVSLVSARAESYFSVYRLERLALTTMARRMGARVRRVPAAAEGDRPAFDRKVLRTYLDEEGRITAVPSQAKKRLVVLRHVLATFEPGRRYSEKQVTELIKRFSSDEYVTLRRYLIDYGLMEREGGGGAYWRVG